MADMDTSNTEAPSLSKKQLGRLKKLRKRIQERKRGSETSDLTTPSDVAEWNELLMLQAACNDETLLAVGPSVRLRKEKQGDKWQNSEGADQRDVLWKMVQHLSTPKKRKRDKDEAIRIPPWCTLHNPCAVQSVAVVELCLNDAFDWNITRVSRIKTTISSKSSRREVLSFILQSMCRFTLKLFQLFLSYTFKSQGCMYKRYIFCQGPLEWSLSSSKWSALQCAPRMQHERVGVNRN